MPHQRKVKSLRALCKLKITSKRDDGVEITRAGSHYKARFRGRAKFVFGASVNEARSRLFSLPSRRWGFVPVPISPFEKQLLDSLR